MNDKLEQVVEVLKLQKSLNSQPTTVELYDEEGVLVYVDNAGVGEHHGRGDSASDSNIGAAMSNGPIRTSEEYRGTTIECNYVPVEDNGEVCGCIVTKLAPKTNEAAIEKAEVFMDCIDRISSAIDMMSIHFENLFDALKAMQDKTGSISESVENTSNVVAKIKANASKSKILALNASIEAARSGEAGRGFTVVAKEMGEMATASGTSASEINAALKEIFGHLDEITTAIGSANGYAEKQTGSVKEIEEYLQAAIQAAGELGQALTE